MSICTCIGLGPGDEAAIGLGVVLFVAIAIIWVATGVIILYAAHRYVSMHACMR